MRVPLALVCALILVAGCSAGEDRVPQELVVEAFFDTGQGLPEVIVRRTIGLDVPFPNDGATLVAGAEVALEADGVPVPYAGVPGRPGRYRPEIAAPVEPRTTYSLRVRADGREAVAETVTPPRFRIERLEITPAPRAVRAVLLDSLRLDSLGIGGRQGFIYPIEVRVWWRADFPETGTDSLYWIRAQLRSDRTFPSSVVDFFFPRETLLRERTVARDVAGLRSWAGVYAVPVVKEDDPLPEHRVRIALVRGGPEYARFIASRQNPEQREPFTNVRGGLGIVAGVSVDSVRVEVR